MVTGEWEMPATEETGTLRALGRRLRSHYGSAMAGLDGGMLTLLEKLFDIPFGTDATEPALAPDPAPPPIAAPRRSNAGANGGRPGPRRRPIGAPSAGSQRARRPSRRR